MISKINTIKELLLNPQYNKSKKLCYVFFVLIIFLFPIYMFVIEYDWLTSGEMWAETATNYYANAKSGNLIQSLFATDSGYWSFPLRITAYIPVLLHIPAKFAPYFYNWIGILIIPLFVAPFCLPDFRKVIESDIFRFVICLCFLFLTDFKTVTFINFLVYSIFLIFIISNLAVIEGKGGKIPKWSWFIPLLIVSKPVILAVIPIMIICSFFANKKYRLITIISLILGLLQLTRLYLSLKSGTFFWTQESDFSTIDKISSSFIVSVKYMLLEIFGNKYDFNITLSSMICFVLFALLYKIYRADKIKNKAIISAIMGILMIFFTCSFLCFSLSYSWNKDAHLYLALGRYLIGCIVGGIFIAAGFAEILNKKFKNTGLLLFIFWFVSSGFLALGLNKKNVLDFPSLNCSTWQKSYAYNSNNTTVSCIPINPYPWIYKPSNKCVYLNKYQNLEHEKYKFEIYNNEKYNINQVYKNELSEINLEAILIYAKPVMGKNINVDTIAKVKLINGEISEFKSTDKLHTSGSVIQILMPINDINIEEISFEFSEPVEIRKEIYNNEPIILWLGSKKE